MSCSECNKSGEFICECRRRFCQLHMNNHQQLSKHRYCPYKIEIDEFFQKHSEVRNRIISDSAKLIKYFEKVAKDLLKILDFIKEEIFVDSIGKTQNILKNFKDVKFPSHQLDNIQIVLNKALFDDYIGKITTIVPPKFDSLKEIKAFYETHGLFLEGHTMRISCIAVSNNNNFFVSCSYDQTLKIWDLKLKKQIADLRGHTSSVLTVAITKDNNYLVSGGRDNRVIKWDIKTNTLLMVKQIHDSYVLTVAMTTDNKFIVSGSEDTIAISNFNDLNLVKMLHGHSGYVRSLVITNDNKFIISGADDNIIIIWNLITHSMKSRLEDHSMSVIGIALMSEDKFMISKSQDKTIKLWNLRTEKFIKKIEGNGNLCNLYVPKGKSVILTEKRNRIIKYNISKDTSSSFNTELTEKFSSIVATNDNKYIITGGEEGTLCIFGFKKPHDKTILPGHTALVTAIEISTDYRLLISASDDMTVRVWNVETRSQETIFKGHKSSILSLAITSDNNFVVSGDTNGIIIIWNLVTRMKVTDLQGHDSRIITLAFISNNHFLLSGSDNQTAIIWNLHTYAIENIYRNEYEARADIRRFPDAAYVLKKIFPNF